MDEELRTKSIPVNALADMLLSDLAEAKISHLDPVDLILKRAGVKYPTAYLRFVISKAALSERNSRAVAARRALKAAPSSAEYDRAKQRFEVLARTHNAAMSLYEEWTVNGKKLGSLRRDDLESAARDADRQSQGLARNAAFYKALLGRMGDAVGVLADVVSEVEALRIRDEVFG